MQFIVNFIKTIIAVAFILGTSGTLLEATGFMGKEAAKAHRQGGMSLKWLNQQLVGRKLIFNK